MKYTIVDAAGDVVYKTDQTSAPAPVLGQTVLEGWPDADGLRYTSLGWVAKPVDMPALRAAKWETMKRHRAAAEQADFTWDGSVFQADLERITGAAIKAFISLYMGLPFQEPWTLSDNSVRTLDASQMIAVGMALASQISAAHANGRLVRAQIDAAATPQQLDAVSWPA